MRLIKSLTILLAMALVIAGCTKKTEKKSVDDIFGKWKLLNPEAMVELFIYPDSTFHVDVLINEGIEVEGKLILENEEITFINVQGTDSVSSDPSPGRYKYSIDKELLKFIKIDDPLSRRSNFLSQDWQRIQ